MIFFGDLFKGLLDCLLIANSLYSKALLFELVLV